MDLPDLVAWCRLTPLRERAILSIDQPLTARHLSLRETFSLDVARHLLRCLTGNGLTRCLNPSARRSRLFWLTVVGQAVQKQLSRRNGKEPAAERPPKFDWDLYGWACYSQRAAVITAMDRPFQPAEVKRRIRVTDDSVRISANNVRDIMRLLHARGLVQKIPVRRGHPRYQLTEAGQTIRHFLMRSTRRPAWAV